jgi:hypothetical protein
MQIVRALFFVYVPLPVFGPGGFVALCSLFLLSFLSGTRLYMHAYIFIIRIMKNMDCLFTQINQEGHTLFLL